MSPHFDVLRLPDIRAVTAGSPARMLTRILLVPGCCWAAQPKGATWWEWHQSITVGSCHTSKSWCRWGSCAGQHINETASASKESKDGGKGSAPDKRAMHRRAWGASRGRGVYWGFNTAGLTDFILSGNKYIQIDTSSTWERSASIKSLFMFPGLVCI